MRKLKVILDCDDVLFICNAAAIERLNREKGTAYTEADIKKWGHMGSPIDERIKYFSDPEFVRNQPVCPGAVQFVTLLQKHAEIFICTSVPADCAGERFNAIRKNFPMILPENIIFGSRKDLLQADLMLDDSIRNLEHSAGVKYPVLFQKPWNEYNRGMLSVNSYPSFLSLVHRVYTGMLLSSEPKAARALALIGPTGSGKNAVADYLVHTYPERFVKPRMYTTTEHASGSHYRSISRQEFAQMESAGCFVEKSTYAGNLYGIRKEDLESVILDNRIPVMVLDANGAFTVSKSYQTYVAFVSAEKEDCIRNILERDIPLEEKVIRLSFLENEFGNAALCDVSITGDTEGAERLRAILEHTI